MKLKTIEIDGNKYAELSDGKPIYKNDDGSENSYDLSSLHRKITSLNGEAMNKRQALEEAESKLSRFGDLDPDKAKDAITKLSNLDDKDLMDADQVEALKVQIAQSYAEKEKELTDQLTESKSNFRNLQKQIAFSGSKYILENLAMPADIAQAYFGKHFEFDNNNLVAKDHMGNVIYSRQNPGDVATFDEAIEQIVNSYPQKDSILKASGHAGSGSTGETESGGKRSFNRAQFDKMSPKDQKAVVTAVNEGKAVLAD